jgi:hypothetical protein
MVDVAVNGQESTSGITIAGNGLVIAAILVPVSEERYCANCREPLARGATWCEACGTDAGEVFDGRVKQKRERSSSWITIVVLLALLAAAAWLTQPYWRRYVGDHGIVSTSAPKVVKQRPGGARRAAGASLSEPEAMMALRKSLQMKDQCLAVISRGDHAGSYSFDAVDRCGNRKLGSFRVDGNSGAVTQR